MITLKVDNQAHLSPVSDLPSAILNRIRDRLSFTNPKWEENQKRRFSNWQVPEELCYLEGHGDHITVPRGFARQLAAILHQVGVQYEIDDRRRVFPEVDFTFKGELRDFQVEAVEAMSGRDFGTLAAPTGSGKTIVALALVARRRQPALILVHSKELQKQWVDRIGEFLGIPAGEVGIIGNGKMKVGEKISVAMTQTLSKCAPKISPHIGFLIADECHRCPSRTFTEAVTAFDCRYMNGLSATPWRRDGLSRLIGWYLGDKVHEVDKAALVDAGHVLQAEVVWRETDFEPTYDPSKEYSWMIRELCEDPARNALIASDVAREAGNGGGVCLVLSERKNHVETLAGLLAARGVNASILTGGMSMSGRRAVVGALNEGKVTVLVSTISLLSEGFDCKELSTLFLATPVRFEGRLIQSMGRVLRPAPGKDKAKVYDYVDPVGVLEHSAKARQRVYGQI